MIQHFDSAYFVAGIARAADWAVILCSAVLCCAAHSDISLSAYHCRMTYNKGEIFDGWALMGV